MNLNGYAVLDVETTIKSHLGRKASPFTPDNWIVAAAVAHNSGPVQGSYWGFDKRGSSGWLRSVLAAKPRFIVGFNIKFDILHLVRDADDYAAYQQWIVDGGELWDSQLAEYLLDGQKQESHMLSLDEVAPRYGGTLKIDEVKAMWEQGINTPDIPKQLLMDYLVGRGDDLGDIGNTRAVFLGQLAAAKKAGQVKSIRLNNGALVATIEMERNGLFVNKAEGLLHAKKLKERLDSLTLSLQTYVPTDLPFEWKWTSRNKVSALIFGGRIKYEKPVHQTDEDERLMYAQKSVTGYEQPDGSYTLTPGPFTLVYGSGKRFGLPKTKQIKVDDHTRPKFKKEEFWYSFPGHTKPKPEWKNDSGYYSTKAEVIEELGGRGIQFLDDFADLKDIEKDLGTYYITEDVDEETGEVLAAKGMLTLVGEDSIVHGNISGVSTVTGRFAHSKPNLGNLPRSDTSDVKKMFQSRWGILGEMMSSDFTSVEVYAQAWLSEDEQLIEDLRAGLDMHIKRLSQAEAKPYEWLVEQIKVLKDKAWINKRKHIKTFSFQRQYGAGPPKIARFLKLPVETIEAWVRADEEMYPGTVQFNERTARTVKQSRVPTATWRMHSQAKIQVQLGEGWLRTFDGKRYSFKENIAPEFMLKRGVLANFSPPDLKNYPVQGLGGEVMKAAMWIAVRAFYFYKNFGNLALLILTVHDAVYADAHKQAARKAGVLLHASMLAASDFMEWFFDHTIPVPIPSETTHGSSMFVEEPFEDAEAFDKAAQKARTWLRTKFMDGYTPSYLA